MYPTYNSNHDSTKHLLKMESHGISCSKMVSSVVKTVIRGISCSKDCISLSKDGNSLTEMPNQNDDLFENVLIENVLK